MVRNFGKRKRSYSNVAVKKRKFSRRKISRNRRKYRGRGNRPVRLYQPVPTRSLVKFNYISNYQIQVNAGAYAQQYWQSSLYDPDYTLGGHQPLWHDQFAQLYRKYRVYGFKYHITLSNRADSAGNLVWGHVSHVPSSFVSTTNIETEMERRLCKHKFTLQNNTGRGGFVSLKGYIPVAKTEGLGYKEFGGHEDYESNFGGNPTKTAKLVLGFYSPSVEMIRGIVRLRFYAECYDPISVSGS